MKQIARMEEGLQGILGGLLPNLLSAHPTELWAKIKLVGAKEEEHGVKWNNEQTPIPD